MTCSENKGVLSLDLLMEAKYMLFQLMENPNGEVGINEYKKWVQNVNKMEKFFAPIFNSLFE